MGGVACGTIGEEGRSCPTPRRARQRGGGERSERERRGGGGERGGERAAARRARRRGRRRGRRARAELRQERRAERALLQVIEQQVAVGGKPDDDAPRVARDRRRKVVGRPAAPGGAGGRGRALDVGSVARREGRPIRDRERPALLARVRERRRLGVAARLGLGVRRAGRGAGGDAGPGADGGVGEERVAASGVGRQELGVGALRWRGMGKGARVSGCGGGGCGGGGGGGGGGECRGGTAAPSRAPGTRPTAPPRRTPL